MVGKIRIIENKDDEEKLGLILKDHNMKEIPVYMSIYFWKDGGISIATGEKMADFGPHFYLPKEWIKKLKDEFIFSKI